MIYFITGYMRSGTSMMMRCLEAGGMDAAYRGDRDEMMKRYSDEDYEPNPALYELDRADYLDPQFPRQFEGKLLKALTNNWRASLFRLPRGDYSIVHMLRHPEEIRQSFDAFFDTPMGISADKYIELQSSIAGVLAARADVVYTPLWYRSVVDCPALAFRQLHAAGWPIDPDKAAAEVEERRCRFRIESLDEGVSGSFMSAGPQVNPVVQSVIKPLEGVNT